MRSSHLAALTAAAAVLTLAGCTSSLKQNVNTTAANTAANTAPAEAAATKAASAAKSGAAAAQSQGTSTSPATVGDAINLTDMENDKIAVTLVKVDPKPSATDGFSSPPSGDRYYAVQVEIKNTGSSAYSDAPSNCMIVKDAKGQQFQTDIVQSISSGPVLGDTVNLAAGDSSLGWLVFDVPTADTITKVQFTVDSGMGSDTAQWSLS